MNIRPQLKRAAGIDIHSKQLSVCFFAADKGIEEVRDYETFTLDLERVRDDLLTHNIRDVIMESTGVYWIALCSILTAAGIRVHIVNPRFVKNMPKEKTDKKDARWLCKLLVNNLIRNSYIATDDQRAFRELCRMRIKYTQHITQSQNRILKNLERSNVKIRSVASSMDTKSVHDIVSAIAKGESDVQKLASLCKGKMKKKNAQMQKALQGVITKADRLMLQKLLSDIAHYRKQIEAIETEIEEHTKKVKPELLDDLREVAGIGRQATEIILAEVGDNVKAFSNEDKLSAWVGLAPGNKESGGKSLYTGTRQGNKTLRTTMIQVAWAAIRTRNSYWRALYYHLSRRMPQKKAIVAIARKLIRVVYKILAGKLKYKEYGTDYFIEHMRERLAQKRPHTITLKEV
jgi:transposase